MKCKDCAKFRKYLISLRDRMKLLRSGSRKFLRFPQEIDDYLFLMREGKERE